MSSLRKVSYLLLFTCGVSFPILVAAQSKGPSSTNPAPTLNDQQKAGEALFLQNCPLCHVYSDQKKSVGIPMPPLTGLFRKSINEDAVRQLILQGIPKKMPGFRYDLEPKELDDIIAYLKTL